jgi:hypothetical protein
MNFMEEKQHGDIPCILYSVFFYYTEIEKGNIRILF